jgi:predicted nucleic-acid-binding protein
MADDRDQFATAQLLLQLFSRLSPGFVSLVSLAEFAWVLQSRYRQSKADILNWLSTFVDSPEIVVESQDVVVDALKMYESGNAQFADCLIERAGNANGCGETVTFDKKAAKSAGMRLL